MKTFVFTTYGSKWAANALCGRYTKPDSMYILYANTDAAASEGLPEMDTSITSSYFSNLQEGSGIGCIEMTSGVGVYTQETNNKTSAIFSVVLGSDNFEHVGGAEVSSGTSRIIGAAVMDGSNVIAVCELSTATLWAANTSVSIAVPLNIPAYKQNTTEE